MNAKTGWVGMFAGLLLLAGCAGYTPDYALAPPANRAQACHDLRVAVPPIKTKPPAEYSLPLRLNSTAFAPLVTRQIGNRKVFASQTSVDTSFAKLTPQALQQLRSQGYDAVLEMALLQMVGGRAQTSTEQLADVLASPALGIVGSVPKRNCVAAATLEFKLVSTREGRTLYYSTSTGTAATTAHTVNSAVDQSLKLALDDMLATLEAAKFEVAPHPR